MSALPETVLAIVCDKAGDSSATEFSHLSRDLLLDSLDLIAIAMDLEKEFAIEISDADIEACQTVADLIAMTERIVGKVTQ